MFISLINFGPFSEFCNLFLILTCNFPYSQIFKISPSVLLKVWFLAESIPRFITFTGLFMCMSSVMQYKIWVWMKVFAQSLRLCLIPCEFLMLSEVWLLMENFPTSITFIRFLPGVNKWIKISHPKLCHFGQRVILRWKQLKNSRHRKTRSIPSPTSKRWFPSYMIPHPLSCINKRTQLESLERAPTNICINKYSEITVLPLVSPAIYFPTTYHLCKLWNFFSSRHFFANILPFC